jgi:hypothetical protein
LAALADLPGIAARLSADLAAAGIPHAVSGAVAMAAHGFVRATRDIDILVVVPAVRLPAVFAIVRRAGFQGEDRALIESLRERFFAEMRSGPTSVEILVPAIPYHHRLLERAVRRTISGVEVPFLSREDLVVLKMLWRRDKDLADVRTMLAGGDPVDMDRIRATLAELLPADDPRHAEVQRLAAGRA